ncbi:MAG: AAA family ATPase [Microcoleaceae cyanobacterium]
MNLDSENDIATHNLIQLNALSRTIRLSQGQFSLLFARCNYAGLRQQITQQLQINSPFQIHSIQLPASSQVLYGAVQTELGEEKPEVVVVFGLETVEKIDNVLHAANLAREVFRNFSFPLIIWIDDNIWHKLNRIAPDFTSWGTTYEFFLGTEELVEFISDKIQQILNKTLEVGASQFISNDRILGVQSAAELQSAYQDLKNLDPTTLYALEASLRLVFGRYYYTHQQIKLALEQYQIALQFWQTEETISAAIGVQNTKFTLTPLEWQSLLCFHIGLCYFYQAEQHLQHSGQKDWEQARIYLKRCIDGFTSANRPDLVGRFINKLGEVLRHLQEWDALEQLALQSRQIHQESEDLNPFLKAQDYGFLAEVELHRGNWQGTKELATVALEILNASKDNPVKNQHRGLYGLLLAQALGKLGEIDVAITQLEQIHLNTNPKYAPTLYLQILKQLQQFYFSKRQYKKAFDVKKEHRNKSTIFGYTAFIGAGRLQPREIAFDPSLGTIANSVNTVDELNASGRETAVVQLLKRLSSPQYKLTVIYGESGVGKSSLIRVALVPALKQQSIDTRTVSTTVIRTYNTYEKELEKSLKEELGTSLNLEENNQIVPPKTAIKIVTKSTTSKPKTTSQAATLLNTLDLIKQNTANNRLVVLIFDQFEDFFFLYKEPGKRQIFFNFLNQCLNLPFVKVVLSLRDDCLHLLLDCVRSVNLEVINNDILSQNILFYLDNLKPDEAFNVIKSLSSQSHFYLEDKLIKKLVEDLTNELGEVRPIELQVVGAQLQTEQITTLEHYQKKGPKAALVERFLGETIRDCGKENERAAKSVLYLLTNENNTRPLKTRTELADDLQEKLEIKIEPSQLNLVLYIIERSGLVSREVSVGAEFYQLVHDYLVGFIRQQHQNEWQAQFDKLQQENVELQRQAQMSKALVEAQKKLIIAENRSRQLERFLATLIVAVVASSAGLAFWQRQQAVNARIAAVQSAQDALVVADGQDQLGILQASVEIGQNLEQTNATAAVQNSIAAGLRPLISHIQERNRLLNHENGVLDVSYSPDGQRIATASLDQTVKLWQADGVYLQDLVHDAPVTSIRFNPTGTVIATTTADLNNMENNKVLLWDQYGDRMGSATMSHDDAVTSVSFHPTQNQLASGSYDQTIKIWTFDGVAVRTLRGHRDTVLDVEYHPQGQILASASADGTVKLWRTNGTLLKTFRISNCSTNPENDCLIYDIAFSPDGETLVIASGDRSVKLWDWQKGTERLSLRGHNDSVLSVNFSPDGSLIASGSQDQTVKLWTTSGTLLNTFSGHNNNIRAVQFSPDSQMIASASEDNTVRLWARHRNPLDTVLQGHERAVWGVSLSPDGETIATASHDNTVRLWQIEAEELGQTPVILPHSAEVNRVEFSPDGELLATVSDSPQLRIWNRSGELVQTLAPHQQRVTAVDWRQDGEYIATGSDDNTVKLLSDEGDLIQTLIHDGPIVDLQFHPQGNLLAVATSISASSSSNKRTTPPLGFVQLWQQQGETWEATGVLSASSRSVKAIDFISSLDVFAIAVDQTVIFWSPQRGESCPLQHEATVRSLSFDPDSQTLATASDDKKVRLWQFNSDIESALWPQQDCPSNTAPLQPFYTINQDVLVNSVGFNSTGDLLAIAKNNGTVVLWDTKGTQLDYQIQQNCQWLGDYLQSQHQNSKNQASTQTDAEKLKLCSLE